VDWALFFQLVGTFGVAIVGGWLGHHLASRRDLANERRKLTVGYLLQAYRLLESASNQKDPDKSWPQIESAVADIQVLGSGEQVEMARAFALGMQATGTAALDPLIHDLRRSLRAELSLAPVTSNIIYMRFFANVN
jgi:hypothetical protein